MSNHVKYRDLKRKGSRGTKVPRFRKKRAKTFKTEDAAKKWAEAQGIKKYSLVNIKNDESNIKKLKIVSE